MHYTDDVRHFNFVSGFVLGALVGAGLGLIGKPLRRPRSSRRIRGGAARAGRSAREGMHRMRKGALQVGTAAKRSSRRSRFGIGP
jgi:hypothetical protein